MKKAKHAAKKLETALRLNQHFHGCSDPSNAAIHTILSQVHSRNKEYEKAIEELTIVKEITERASGANSISVGSVHL